MSSIDLNIIQRGAASDFNWTAGPGRITAADLGNIGEQRTDNGGALNALPTPFARFYIFKEAFRRVLEERNNPSKQAGRAYERLVSNCLDVFELLYNKNYHENLWQGSDICTQEILWYNPPCNGCKAVCNKHCIHYRLISRVWPSRQIQTILYR